jgi:two-component system KDP operon response regulator KdpE
VDDEPQIRKLLQIGLSGYGYEVITAADGHEALTSAAQHSPTLIVLDITLGSQPDGLHVCKNLREWSQIPVIILSVLGEEKTKVLALDAGADGYLPALWDGGTARIQAVLSATMRHRAHRANQVGAHALTRQSACRWGGSPRRRRV